MTTRAKVLGDYVKRGLKLIQVANGVNAKNVAPQLNKLNKDIAKILATPPPRGRAQREELLRVLQALVLKRYGQLARVHGSALRTVVGAEAQFARRTMRLASAPSREALARAVASLIFTGAPAESHWEREAQTIGFRLGSQIRTAWNNAESAGQIQERVFGTGQTGRGGVMQSARDNAEKIVDTGVQAAASAGRYETWKANGVNAVRWFSVLDPHVCTECGLRAGKLYDMNYEPIGHDVAMDQEPPLHYWCRCMLIPEKYDDGEVPEDSGKDADKFEDCLETLSEKEQAEILGAGRAQLWREGTITLTDLIDQNGRILPMSVLLDD